MYVLLMKSGYFLFITAIGFLVLREVFWASRAPRRRAQAYPLPRK